MSTSTTRRTIQVTEGPLADFKIHVEDVGSGEAVVMLHGSGPGATGRGNFARNVDVFVQAGFRVLLVDQPGWGGSDTVVVETGNRVGHNAAAVKGVLDALGIERAHLVGNSMGGVTALQSAINQPTRIAKVIVMGGGAGGLSPFVPMPTEGIKLLFALYRDPTIENLKRMLSVFVFDASTLTDELLQSRLSAMCENPQHIEAFVKSMDRNPRHLIADLTPRLAEVKAKTLVVWGRDDRFVPLDAGLRLVWALPDAQLHVFSRCGHWAQWEHAADFNRLAIDFIRH